MNTFMNFMNTLAKRFAVAAVLLPATLNAQALSQGAPAVTAGDIQVSAAWARAAAATAPVGGAFVTLINHGRETDSLVAASSTVADTVELHTHTMDGGVMRMRAVAAMELAPGAVTEMKPGGLHIMLIGLKAPLTEGGRFPLTLTFQRAGTVTVPVAVRGAGAMGAAPGHGHGG